MVLVLEVEVVVDVEVVDLLDVVEGRDGVVVTGKHCE